MTLLRLMKLVQLRSQERMREVGGKRWQEEADSNVSLHSWREASSWLTTSEASACVRGANEEDETRNKIRPRRAEEQTPD